MKAKLLEQSQAAFFFLSILLLSVCGILLFLLPQRTYSENENRFLTTFKPPSFSDFLDTSMQENITDASNDQFAGRDLWVQSASTLQRAAGMKDIGGVYLGRDGYYFERILDSQISESRYQNNLSSLEQFAAMHDTAVFFLPVPPKGSILKEYLPAHAVLFNNKRLCRLAADRLQHAACMDIRSDLEAGRKTGPVYFKTDHHWTMNGAYLAYAAFCRLQKVQPKPLSYFAPECASKDFLGTLYSKAPVFGIQPEALFMPKHLPEAEVFIDSAKADGVYSLDKLHTKDKYGVYFGGNFARIDIRMGSTNKTKKLAVIKDSFANSLIPFLMEDYKEIILLDLRYYNASVSDFMQAEQPDETLVLYEMSNFAQDINFFKILK